MYRERMSDEFLRARWQELKSDVRHMGADSYDILLPETRMLAVAIDLDEKVEGIVYGRYKQQSNHSIGRGALIATDRRILLIDRKPVYVKCDEIGYMAVSGVSYVRVGVMGTVTLHTRLGDINLRTFNKKCAEGFVKAVEQEVFNRKQAFLS
jgi:hypothetical protein